MKWIPFNPDWQQFAEQPRPARPVVEPGDAQKTLLDHCKVVMAEDDAVSRDVVCSLLRNWGFDVLVTQDGNEALEALRAQSAPTLAVLDWMPGTDGVEVCRRVRAMDKLVTFCCSRREVRKSNWWKDCRPARTIT
jgi:PleD family two-component response regulator